MTFMEHDMNDRPCRGCYERCYGQVSNAEWSRLKVRMPADFWQSLHNEVAAATYIKAAEGRL